MCPESDDVKEQINYLVRNLEILEEKCNRDIQIKNFSNVYTYMGEYNSFLEIIKEEIPDLSDYFRPIDNKMNFMDRWFRDRNIWYLAKLTKVDHYASQLLVDIVRTTQLGSGGVKSDSLHETSDIIKILDLAENKLRKTFRESPKNEGEVQDRFEDLLIAREIEYFREQEKIAYSSKTYQPDFSFPAIATILEFKFCDKKGREKEIIAEINDDILAYKTKYPNIIFIVYDMGFVRDVDKFKEDIESMDNIIVKVVKH